MFSRLNNGQSSSGGASQDCVITSRTLTPQELGKALMQQVYVPKKVEVPVVSPLLVFLSLTIVLVVKVLCLVLVISDNT
jgi:hypothetical protein